MKILLATEAYWPLIDGGAVAEHLLCLGLAKRGHDVHIIAPSEKFNDYTQTDHGTTIHRLASYPVPFAKNNHRLAWNPKRKIKKIMDDFKPDVVHIHNPFPIGKNVLNYCKAHNIPTLATNHWLPENILTFNKKLRFLNKFNILVKLNWKFIINFHNECNFVTSPTQTAVQLMLDNGLKAPNKPVSNGIDLDKFNPKHDPTPLRKRLGLPNKPTLLYAGRLSGEKHVDILIRSIPLIREKLDVHVIIGGNGREKENLIQLTKELNIAEYVTFPGFLSDEEFPLLYRSADLFVMPSICELQSITTLEALASGLPAIGANKYALPELIHPNKNGDLFEPKDSETLAHQAISILSNEQKLENMGKASLEIVAAHKLEKTIDEYTNIYTEIINQ